MKKIAPIIITIFAMLLLTAQLYGVFIVTEEVGFNFVVVLFGLGIILIFGALIFNLVKRLIEIDKEKDDDISKYWFYYR